jgi:hypothetical protein
MLDNELREWINEHASKLVGEADRYSSLDYIVANNPLPGDWCIIEPVYHEGGEGEGETYFDVFRFTDANGVGILIRVNAWYQSYCGAEYDDWQEVQAVERMVTFYE